MSTTTKLKLKLINENNVISTTDLNENYGIMETALDTTLDEVTPGTIIDYNTINNNFQTIDDEWIDTSVANATNADILSGKTAFVNKIKLTGTMANQGAVTAALNAGGSYTIPAGYHNGSGKITANSLSSQTVADATAANILSGKTAYVNGVKITGNIVTRNSNNLTASGATVTVPEGYYASTASKAVTTATQATPSVSINTSSGLITASATQTAGYVAAGTKSGTKQLTVQAAKTVTPSTTNQTAVAANVYTTGAVTVKGDANLKAENIKSGVSIFGITGTNAGSAPTSFIGYSDYSSIPWTVQLSVSMSGTIYNYTCTATINQPMEELYQLNLSASNANGAVEINYANGYALITIGSQRVIGSCRNATVQYTSSGVIVTATYQSIVAINGANNITINSNAAYGGVFGMTYK